MPAALELCSVFTLAIQLEVKGVLQVREFRRLFNVLLKARREFEPEPPAASPDLIRNLFNSDQETHNWRGLGC